MPYAYSRHIFTSYLCAALLLLSLILSYNLFMATQADAAKAQHNYRGNPNSMIYHNSSCRYFNCKACVVSLSSPAEAKKRGYRACKKCKG